ncbi:hypothetical protein DY000_02050268 [Brassica cretica]|uniref:Uncharacterized protein n=1 Tax=Brassica cretica TaxID=69181 RepID=A0ABQ7EU80_BRACR|nr:hypothetical protein DY000_02050268 [Brassica cretica]
MRADIRRGRDIRGGLIGNKNPSEEERVRGEDGSGSRGERFWEFEDSVFVMDKDILAGKVSGEGGAWAAVSTGGGGEGWGGAKDCGGVKRD